MIRTGAVDLDLPVTGGSRLIVHLVGPGELVGSSWLAPPYRACFGAVTAEPTMAMAPAATRLRARVEADRRLGHLLSMTLLAALVKRLESAKDRIREAHRGDFSARTSRRADG